MEDTLTTEPTAEEAAQIRSSVQEILQQLEQSNGRIKRYQAETDALKAETRAMLTALEAMVKT